MHNEPKDEEFPDYQDYLQSPYVWPSAVGRGSREEHKDVPEMAPQYAAAALAKLVRWARYAPVGEASLWPDEDARENFVRMTPLGVGLAARACNLDPDHFYGLYGEYGAGKEADYHEVLAEMAVTMGDHGLGDWQLKDRIVLSAKILEALARFKITQRP